MSTQQALPKDDPRMIAWSAYNESDEYANSFKWAQDPAHRDGSMWAAFIAGWAAASDALRARPLPAAPDWQRRAAEEIAGDVWHNLNGRTFEADVRAFLRIIRKHATILATHAPGVEAETVERGPDWQDDAESGMKP